MILQLLQVDMQHVSNTGNITGSKSREPILSRARQEIYNFVLVFNSQEWTLMKLIINEF